MAYGLTLRILVLAISLAPALALGMGGYSGGGNAPETKVENPLYDADVKAVRAKDFRGAIPLLENVVAADAKNADAFNCLGFSHRKLGEFDKALGHYQTALNLKPDHRGAHQYIGELYLELNDLKRDEEHLARLDRLCLFGCEEYTDLKSAVAAYKKARGIT